MDSGFNLVNTIWWWQFWWRGEWIPKLITKFGWEAKIRSIQDKDFPRKWVGSLIIYCSRDWEVMASILEPSMIVLSPVYQLLDFALKSPLTATKKRLVAATASRVSSKLSQKFWKSFSDWLGDLYKETKLQVLSPSFIKKVIQSLR